MMHRWVIFAGGQPVSDVHFAAGTGQHGTAAWCVRATTLRSGLSDGVVAIEVDNGAFRFVVLPTRGMSLWRGWIDGRQIGWNSWVQGPVHPRHVPLEEPSGCGWLAGFDELLVRCGLTSNGAPEFGDRGEVIHPQHGRIANLAARDVEVTFDDEIGEIAIHGVVEERRGDEQLELHAMYRTRLGQLGVFIHDEVRNMSAAAVLTQMLYHVNFGTPLLREGARVVAPVRTVVPREEYDPACAGDWSTFWNHPADEEEVYFCELAADGERRSRVLLRNAAGDFGAALSFDVRQLPCFTLWKMMGKGDGGQVTGFEPGTNFPNRRSFEAAHGRARVLAAGESAAYDLELSLHRGPEAVDAVARETGALQSTTKRRIFREPQTGWCPQSCLQTV